jgi:hypothetical protein
MSAVYMGDPQTTKSDVGIAAISFAAIIGGVVVPYMMSKEAPMPSEFRNIYRTQVKWKKPTKLGTTIGIILFIGGIGGLVYTGGKL